MKKGSEKSFEDVMKEIESAVEGVFLVNEILNNALNYLLTTLPSGEERYGKKPTFGHVTIVQRVQDKGGYASIFYHIRGKNNVSRNPEIIGTIDMISKNYSFKKPDEIDLSPIETDIILKDIGTLMTYIGLKKE